MKTRNHLLLFFAVTLVLFSCSREEGSKFPNDYLDPVYPDLVLEEISSETPSELGWLNNNRFTDINYEGNRPLFFGYNRNNNTLISFNDNTGEIKWATQFEPAERAFQSLTVFDYKESLIVFAGRRMFILDRENGQIIEDVMPGEYLNRVFVNGFTCVEDKIYVLTSLPSDNQVLIELFEFDVDQKVGHKLYERSGIIGMEISEFIMQTDEVADYLFFAREIKEGEPRGSYIFKINRHTGEETLFYCGSTQAERPDTYQNLSYINDKFIYLAETSYLIYSFTEDRVIGKTIVSNSFFHGKYCFTWSDPGPFKAFTLEDLKPIWSELYVTHRPWITSQPAAHPEQDIICIPTRSGIEMIDIVSGRMLHIINMPGIAEQVRGVRINDDGTVLYVFTSTGRITTYKWPF